MSAELRIAILGWGSLIWNPRELHITGEWHIGEPTLPIEFSRISDDGRLTLVIDEKDGVSVPTRYAISALTNLGAARENLRAREGTKNLNRIGFVDIMTGEYCCHARRTHPNAFAFIRNWALQNQFNAVIWTAIGPRFIDKTNEPFSIDAAIRYFEKLP